MTGSGHQEDWIREIRTFITRLYHLRGFTSLSGIKEREGREAIHRLQETAKSSVTSTMCMCADHHRDDIISKRRKWVRWRLRQCTQRNSETRFLGLSMRGTKRGKVRLRRRNQRTAETSDDRDTNQRKCCLSSNGSNGALLSVCLEWEKERKNREDTPGDQFST